MVVVIRNQNLTPEQQVNFCSKIGKFQQQIQIDKDLSVYDGILRVTESKK